METVCEKKLSYPTFLWITRCKILFIAGDNVGKTATPFALPVAQRNKIPRFIMLLFPDITAHQSTEKIPEQGGYFLSNKQREYGTTFSHYATAR
ncbi:hypothetical protein [Pantoea alhagi]|uniref:hypothetical protein n=1 Tax=Pantoea alhagi TaxID=1891675 RepID=UPI00142D9A2E|nr:hypothetical protein [Pantoea alhagi]